MCFMLYIIFPGTYLSYNWEFVPLTTFVQFPLTHTVQFPFLRSFLPLNLPSSSPLTSTYLPSYCLLMLLHSGLMSFPLGAIQQSTGHCLLKCWGAQPPQLSPHHLWASPGQGPDTLHFCILGACYRAWLMVQSQYKLNIIFLAQVAK